MGQPSPGFPFRCSPASSGTNVNFAVSRVLETPPPPPRPPLPSVPPPFSFAGSHRKAKTIGSAQARGGRAGRAGKARGEGETLLKGFSGEGQRRSRVGRVRGGGVAPETPGPGTPGGSGGEGFRPSPAKREAGEIQC